MTIKALVIDDERYAREELIYLLEQFEDIYVSGEVENGEDALKKVLQEEPDVVFLDVEMPRMNGLEVARALSKLKQVPYIIFATAYPDFAVDAFRINATDYLLKPYEIEPLTEAIEKVKAHFQPKNSIFVDEKVGKFPVEHDGEIDYIEIKAIKYIAPEGKGSVIHTGKQAYHVKASLKDLETKLLPYNFFRIHRSYLVNLNDVKRLVPWFNGAYQLELVGLDGQLPVSRNYVKELQKKLAF